MSTLTRAYKELIPFQKDIDLRIENYKTTKNRLIGKKRNIYPFADAHKYFGFHHVKDQWIYREWAPGASMLYLTGDFNHWNWESHPLKKEDNGVFTIALSDKILQEYSRVKVIVKNGESCTEHLPLFTMRAVQNNHTGMWHCEVVDEEKKYPWTDENFQCKEPLYIYEAHIGMAQEEEKIGSYLEFADKILPRIKEAGYNAVQLMGIMEHPYYGSFGYQVTNFYAPSSRFGYPDELRYLINKAHTMGIRVLLDLVHSHAATNTLEGLNMFDGTPDQFFWNGPRGDHTAWGTKCFHYGKDEVIRYLLSNIRYWMEDFHFDGFRFDGVTSMLYLDHGIGSSFQELKQYFTPNTDTEAVTYLQLANKLIKEINKDAISIAEDMSGMPLMCSPISIGGIGFDYRLGMGIPDMWIRLVKDLPDEQWNLTKIWIELTFRNAPTVAYAESHDQALVGDKTLIFRLADSKMYTDMDKICHNEVIDRAIALHKMIRLLTMSAGGNAYLNFMGNEFGHPEWIDFPRDGNRGSYKYCRRQWSLLDNGYLKYGQLNQFDKDIVKLTKEENIFSQSVPDCRKIHDDDHILAFERKGLLFVFNFHPQKAFYDYILPVSTPGDWQVILSTDDEIYGGFGNIKKDIHSAFIPGIKGNNISLGLPPRTAMVLKCTT